LKQLFRQPDIDPTDRGVSAVVQQPEHLNTAATWKPLTGNPATCIPLVALTRAKPPSWNEPL
jgi:hypothetical protein